jgi:cystathionine beta-lyase/cystathionine gamma-synthase
MKNKPVNSSRMPVYRDAGFELHDAEATRDAFEKETENEHIPDVYIYSRYRNPTVIAAEEDIMNLEGSRWAVLTQSGMAAIDTALSVFQQGSSTGPWLFFSEIYGGTISFNESVLKSRRGIDIHYFNPFNEQYDISEFEKIMITLKPSLVYLEAISNPMLIVPAASDVIYTAQLYGARVIIDNTFSTPALWKPLESGADLVIHSATKYLSGHGNITAGVVCGNDKELMKSVIEYRKFVGHMLSPDDAYRLKTQMQTFKLRFRQQCANASALSLILNEHPLIKKVWYPGLEGHPSHEEAVRLFGNRGFGGMITFDFDGENNPQKKERRDTFIKAVSQKIKLIPSLGDPRTILMPVESVWGARYPEPGMIRLSVGFEEYDELEMTIKEGLQAAG